MSNRFAQLLDEINGLELDKKIEIANILEKSITETSPRIGFCDILKLD